MVIRLKLQDGRGRGGRKNTTTTTIVLGLAMAVFFQFKNNVGFNFDQHVARFTIGLVDVKVPTTLTVRHAPPPSSQGEPPRGGSGQFCLERRGTSGRWIQDWDYANRSSYPNHGSYSTWHLADQNFTKTPDQPYRLAMSYRWIDDECPVHEVDIEDFCGACVALGIHQILVLGDSLNIEFVQSLQSLLGFPPEGRRATAFNARFKPWTMTCPSHGPSSLGHKITFWLMRYQPHSDWKQLGDEARNNNGRARDFIDKSTHKTAIVANLGAWMQGSTQFEEAVTWFLEWMASLRDPSKVVPFWRPTVPGHLGCHPEGTKEEIKQYNWVKPVLQEPYANYLEYKQTQDIFRAKDNDTKRKSWEYFEGWNGWSYQKMYRTNSTTFGSRDRDSFGNNNNNSSTIVDSNHSVSGTKSSSSSHNTIHWLNVFPSTVLRRDGHAGFGDCLHYYLPGPIDWWSHLFHSALLDLANATTMTTKISNQAT